MKDTIVPIPRAAAVADLASTACACTNKKKRGNTFCSRCYFRLPPRMRKDLYELVGDGYEANYAEALQILGLASPALKAKAEMPSA